MPSLLPQCSGASVQGGIDEIDLFDETDLCATIELPFQLCADVPAFSWDGDVNLENSVHPNEEVCLADEAQSALLSSAVVHPELKAVFFDDVFTCPVPDCSEVFSSTKQYRKHRVKFHNLPMFTCCVCSEPFHHYELLTDHMGSVGHSIKCIHCDRRFTRLSSATLHFGLYHKHFKCLHCELDLSGSLAYKFHIKQFHTFNQDFISAASAIVEISMNTSFCDLNTSQLGDNDKPHEPPDVSSLPENPTYLNSSEKSSDLHSLSGDSVELLTTAESGTGDSVELLTTAESGTGDCVELLTTAESGTGDCVELLTTAESGTGDSVELLTSAESGTGDSVELLTTAESGSLQSETAMGLEVPLDSDIGEFCVDLSSNSNTHESPKGDGNREKNSQYIRNPFYEGLESCPVLFGPGAADLIEDSSPITSNQLSFGNHVGKESQWIGHDVDMFLNTSETYQKKYRFKCNKCSMSFQSKVMLQKHSKTHTFTCKQCFLKFDLLSEYKVHVKNHVKNHMKKRRNFVCALCSHTLPDLKSFMKHEVRHELCAVFQEKLEESQSDKKDRKFCRICKKRMDRFPSLLRHEIWHAWPHIWQKYVAKRSYHGVFTVSESETMKGFIEKETILKFRDSGLTRISKSASRKEYQKSLLDDMHHSYEEEASNQSIAGHSDQVSNSAEDESETESSFEESEDLDDSDEDNESGVIGAINSWMNYWLSYIGLCDKPIPSWIKPELRKLRSQWRYYQAAEYESLYRKMDQLAVLLKAHQEERAVLDSPRVILERLSDSSLLHTSLPVAHQEKRAVLDSPRVILERLSDSSLLHTSLPVAHQEKRAVLDSPRVILERLSDSSLSHTSPALAHQKETAGLDSPRVVLERLSESSLSHTSLPLAESASNDFEAMSHEIDVKLSSVEFCRPVVVLSKLLQPIQKPQEHKLVECVKDGRKLRSEYKNLCETSKPLLDKTDSPCPVVRLQKLSNPILKPQEDNNHQGKHDHSKEVTDTSNSSLAKTLCKLRNEFVNNALPRWAVKSIDGVQYDSSIPMSVKKQKMYQIINLIKSELNEKGHSFALELNPYVNLHRLNDT